MYLSAVKTLSTSSGNIAFRVSSCPGTALKSRRGSPLEYLRQKNTREAERTRGRQRVGKCETREIVLPRGWDGGGLLPVTRGRGAKRARRGRRTRRVAHGARSRYRRIGGSIDGGNCYPIESKRKGCRRMDVTSPGTVSPIIGFAIGSGTPMLPVDGTHRGIHYLRVSVEFVATDNTNTRQ